MVGKALGELPNGGLTLGVFSSQGKTSLTAAQSFLCFVRFGKRPLRAAFLLFVSAQPQTNRNVQAVPSFAIVLASIQSVHYL